MRTGATDHPVGVHLAVVIANLYPLILRQPQVVAGSGVQVCPADARAIGQQRVQLSVSAGVDRGLDSSVGLACSALGRHLAQRLRVRPHLGVATQAEVRNETIVPRMLMVSRVTEQWGVREYQTNKEVLEAASVK